MSTVSTIDTRARGPRPHHVRQDHPLAVALLAELAIDYSIRYGDTAGAIHRRLRNSPAADFAAPDGDLLVLVDDGDPIAGGGFRRVDATTAQLKRLWTAREHRRRGLATRVLAELETEMIRLGYMRVFATAGDRQPEAGALYTAAGFVQVASGVVRRSRFEKDLNIGAPKFAAARPGGVVEVLGRRRRRG